MEFLQFLHPESPGPQELGLETHFEMDLGSDVEICKSLAARFDLKEEGVETWFIQRRHDEE